VESIACPAPADAAVDILQANGYLLDTPVSVGYVRALKHYVDPV